MAGSSPSASRRSPATSMSEVGALWSTGAVVHLGNDGPPKGVVQTHATPIDRCSGGAHDRAGNCPHDRWDGGRGCR